MFDGYDILIFILIVFIVDKNEVLVFGKEIYVIFGIEGVVCEGC